MAAERVNAGGAAIQCRIRGVRQDCRNHVELERNAPVVPAFNQRRGQGRAPPNQFNNKEQAMNWDRIEGNWKQLTGKVKEKWGKLTDDDIAQINGNREQLEGKLQARYGYAKDQVRKDVDDWLGRM
jgi:uncharacterized protein YjbJ (UPF0337 family)